MAYLRATLTASEMTDCFPVPLIWDRVGNVGVSARARRLDR